MRVTAALLYDAKTPVVVEEVELFEPGPHGSPRGQVSQSNISPRSDVTL